MQMCRRVLCDRSVLNGLWSHDVFSWQQHCSQLLHHKSRSTILSTCSSEATLVKLQPPIVVNVSLLTPLI